MLDYGKCTLCGRDIPAKMFAEKHHLVPKQAKGKKTVTVCCPCGDQIHELFTNKELRDKYNTVEALLGDPRVQRWVKWIRKTDRWHVRMRSSGSKERCRRRRNG